MSSKKTNTSSNTATNTNTTQNFTSTPTNPGWVTSGVQGLANTVTGLAGQDPSSFVAGADPLQTTAATNAAGLTLPPQFAAGAGDFNSITPSTVGTASLLPNLQSYMSPYTNDVVNSTLANYDKQAGYTQAGQALSLANDDTFGGSGGAIAQSLTDQGLAMNRAQIEAQLRDQGFTQGATLANEDANRGEQSNIANAQDTLAAGQGLTQNAADQNSAANANVNTQSSIGEILQAIAQAKAQAPIGAAGNIASIFDGLPLNLFTGQSGSTDGTLASNSSGNSTSTTSGGSLGWSSKNGFTIGGM